MSESAKGAAEVFGRAVSAPNGKPFDVPAGSRALYIGGGGTLIVVLAGDAKTIISFVGVQAGTILPIAAKKILAGSATDVLALY